MKTITELIAENPLGTEFITEDSLPEASSFTKVILGKKFRCVGVTQIVECDDGSIMTLKSYVDGFDPSRLEDDVDDDSEYDDC